MAQRQLTAPALLEKAQFLAAVGEHEQSLEAFDAAEREFRRSGNQVGGLATAASRLESMAEMERWDGIDRSAQIITETAGRIDPHYLQCRFAALNYQGQAWAAQGDFASAAPPTLSAADVADQLGDEPRAVRSRFIAAECMRLSGQAAPAISAYQAVLAGSRDVLRELGFEAAAARGLADAQQQLAPARFADLAERHAADGDRLLEAACLLRQAEHLGTVTGADTAERTRLYVRAAELFEDAGAKVEAARAWYGAAGVSFMLGRLDPEYRQLSYDAGVAAARLFRASGQYRGEAAALFTAAHALRHDFRQETPDRRALPMLRRSAEAFDAAGCPADAATSLLAVAHELARDAEHPVWIAAAIEALSGYEQARPALQLPADRERTDRGFAWGMRALTFDIDRAAATESGSGPWRELVWLVEQSAKARAFQDEQHQDEAWNALVSSDEQLRGLIRAKEKLERTLTKVERDIDLALADGDSGAGLTDLGAKRAALQADLDDLRAMLHRRIATLDQAEPERAELSAVPPVSIAALQSCLRPGEAYLGFYLGAGDPLRSLVTAGTVDIGVTGRPVDPDVARLAARTGTTLDGIDPEGARRFVGPIPDDIDTLIISPHGLLATVPWHLLPWDGYDTLGDRYSIAVTPSAAVLHRLRARPYAPGRRARAAAYLGVACDGSATEPLICADDEVAAIARNHFSGDPSSRALTTADAGRFLADGCDVRLLHLSCHADRHGLLLSRDGDWTTPIDLLARPGRRFAADVILLTGCYAGDFDGMDNNEFIGVIRQLLVVTGARAAITSIAPIPDAAAPVFADLVVCAMTGHSRSRPWPVPAAAMPVAAAVGWARSIMRELEGDDVEPLVNNRKVALSPEKPSWWSPWYVVGDPQATITG